jgi:hypothetical protein
MLFKVWEGLAVRPNEIISIVIEQEKCINVSLKNYFSYEKEFEDKELAVKEFNEILNELKEFYNLYGKD